MKDYSPKDHEKELNSQIINGFDPPPQDEQSPKGEDIIETARTLGEAPVASEGVFPVDSPLVFNPLSPASSEGLDEKELWVDLTLGYHVPEGIIKKIKTLIARKRREAQIELEGIVKKMENLLSSLDTEVDRAIRKGYDLDPASLKWIVDEYNQLKSEGSPK